MHSVKKLLQQISEYPEYFGSEGIIASGKPKFEHFLYMIVHEFLKQKGIIHIAAIYHSSRRQSGKYRRIL